jgi:DNA-binding beta-propeller fold protein YncE
VDIFDTLSNTRITGLAIAQTVDVAFNSPGTHAYVTSGQTIPGSVYEIDTATFKTTNTYTVGLDPSDIKMSYGDQWLVVNNDSGGSISIIDLLKGTVATTAVGASPTGIAFVH